jgi:YVTN family beta-propeller protein
MMRRSVLLPLLLAPVLWLAPAAPAQAEKLAFVINSASASISVFDVDTRKEVRRIPVLREPHHMALTPDHRFLLVGDTTGNELLYLNPQTGELVRRVPMSDPYQLTFSPDGHVLTIAGLARNQVDIYTWGADDAPKLAKRFPIASMPSHINYAPDSSVVYVSLQESNSLAAFDLKNLSVLWVSKVGSTPAGVLWHGDQILVGIMGGDGVAVVDPVDGHVVRRIHTGPGAHVLFVPPDRKVVYVTDRVDGSIVALDPTTLTEVRRYQLPGGPDDVDFAPDGKIWISRRFAHSVAILDPATGTYDTIETGRSPHGIWLNTHDSFPVAVSSR